MGLSSKNSELEPAQLSEANRRDRAERRKTGLKSMIYAFYYSRRRDQRRDGEAISYYTDWYGAPLFFLAISIALFCVADAFFTLVLISRGGAELNPFMDFLLNKGLYLFVGVKMALTVGAIVLLVLHQRFAFMFKVRAFHVLLATFLGYAALIAYEVTLLSPLHLFE